MISTTEAKKVTAVFLSEHALPYEKLSARTVGFSDLGRGDSVFVKVHGWTPDPAAGELRAHAHANGFCVEFDWPVS